MTRDVHRWPGAVLIAVGILFLCSTMAEAQQRPFFVVVHPDNDIEMMSPEALSRLFLRRVTIWEGGIEARPVDLPPESRVRAAFSNQILGRTTDEVLTFWDAEASRGLSPPPVAANDAEAVERVRSHPGAIAYVSTSAPLEGVKLIPVVTPPKAIRKIPPQYSQKALRFQLEGEVVLRLEISAEGDVEDVTVIQGLGHGLTEEAIRAVKRWKFEPARAGGVPISAPIDVTVAFQL